MFGQSFSMCGWQVNDGPCVTYVGPGGAGNFVKMVHNGIGYGDMQLISEAYDVLRTVGGLTNEEMVEAFNEWNAVSNPSAQVSIAFSSCSLVQPSGRAQPWTVLAAGALGKALLPPCAGVHWVAL